MPPPAEIQAVIEELARGPAKIRQIIYEVPLGLRKRRPAPGMWSAHEHAVHLPAIHPIMNARLDLMLSDPNPYIKSYEPSRDDEDGALLKLDLEKEMDRFERDRATLVTRLKSLTPAEWAIKAGHEEYAQYGVYIMFRHVALHDGHHAYKIEDRLLRKEWD
jgi:hypothetical protein